MKERKTFVFVPSRTAEVIGLKGTLKWTQGEESFYFVYYSMLVLLHFCQTWNISRGNRKKKNQPNIGSFFSPPSSFSIQLSCCTLFMLMNVVSPLFFHFLERQIILVDLFSPLLPPLPFCRIDVCETI